MFEVLEFVGFCSLLVAVWAMYRAAKARPDEPSLLLMARAGLAIWLGFVLYHFIEPSKIVENTAGILKTVIAVSLFALAVIGYRSFLRRARSEADRR